METAKKNKIANVYQGLNIDSIRDKANKSSRVIYYSRLFQ